MGAKLIKFQLNRISITYIFDKLIFNTFDAPFKE